MSEMSISENELMHQRRYMSELTDLLYLRAGNRTPLAMVHTYGCQQNVADSEKLKGMLVEMGCGLTEDKEKADIIIFNTIIK